MSELITQNRKDETLTELLARMEYATRWLIDAAQRHVEISRQEYAEQGLSTLYVYESGKRDARIDAASIVASLAASLRASLGT